MVPSIVARTSRLARRLAAQVLLVAVTIFAIATVGASSVAAAGGTPARRESSPPRATLSRRGGRFWYVPRGGRTAPLLAVAGASFAAGIGASRETRAWPADLARLLGWRLLVEADPGAGYQDPGCDHLGPLGRLARRLDLSRTRPAVIVLQGGHDDIRYPLAKERRDAFRLVRRVHHESPRSLIVLLSVFAHRGRATRRAWATDRALILGARRADPAVLVVNPLSLRWRFPRAPDRLHPTTAGHAWIARHLFRVLLRAGVHPRRHRREHCWPFVPRFGPSTFPLAGGRGGARLSSRPRRRDTSLSRARHRTWPSDCRIA